MKHLKIHNTQQNKKVSIKTLRNTSHPTKIITPRDLCRMILDLKVKDNSYNEIMDYCFRALDIKITKEQIMAIIIAAGKRAKYLNGIYDELVQSSVEILVLDEVFQGRSNCFFGCADARSHYLFLFQDLAHRSEEAISNALHSMGLPFDNLKLAITDGLASYPNAISASLETVLHVLCQVHAYRIILREQDCYHQDAKKALTALNEAKHALEKHRTTIHEKQKDLSTKNRQLDNAIKKRDTYHQKQGIKKYSKKAPWTEQRLKLKAKIANLRAGIRSQKITVNHLKKKTNSLQIALFPLDQDYHKKKQISLQTGRLVHRFHDLMKCSAKDFPTKKIQFEECLIKSKYPIATKIRLFLKDHPALFVSKTKELEALCPPSVATTNIIEGIFGILRPLLTKGRHFHEALVTDAFFEIVRFHFNFTPPFTGINKDKSPLERAGVHSKYTDYLDALFPEKGEKFVINGRFLNFESISYYDLTCSKLVYSS